jgi:hypothetical protein
MSRIFLLSLLSVSLTAGCADGGEESANENPLDEGPGQFEADFETNEQFFTQMTEPEIGLDVSPHEKVRIWYSTNLLPAVDLEEFEAPFGTVAIKTQGYEDDEYTEILVMIKGKAGSSPQSGDWKFEVRTPEGDLVGPSDPDFCSECHNLFPKKGNLPGIVLSN